MMPDIRMKLDDETLVVRIPMRFQRRGGRKRIVAPDGTELTPATRPRPDGTLVKALSRARRWQRMLDEGLYASVSEIGDAENISKSCVSRILRLALVAPDMVDAILTGSTDQGMVLEQLERPLPGSWEEQRRGLGIGTTADDCLGCFRRCTCAPPRQLRFGVPLQWSSPCRISAAIPVL
jgi:hypothetical protein